MRKQLTPFWLLSILTGLNLLNYLDRFVLNAVRTPLAADFKIGYGDSGRTFTAFMIGYFVTSPFFGYLGDRFSRKWLIAFGIFVWSLGTLLTGFASGFAMLLFFRVLVGLGEASYATISPSLISDAFAATRRDVISQYRDTSHPFALLPRRGHLVSRAFGNDFALELRE